MRSGFLRLALPALLLWAFPASAQPRFRTLIDESQFAAAEANARDRLATLERSGQAAATAAAETLNDLAEALLRQINNLAARPIVERAIRIEQARGAEADVPLIRSLVMFAEISDLAIDFKTLQVMVDMALPMAEGLLKPEDRLRIDARHWRAVALFRAGEHAVAERDLKSVLADEERLFGPDSARSEERRVGKECRL